jgi:hypothetical protein
VVGYDGSGACFEPNGRLEQEEARSPADPQADEGRFLRQGAFTPALRSSDL